MQRCSTILANIKKFCNEGNLSKALDATDRADQQGIPISVGIFYQLLQACTKKKDQIAGRKVHNLIIKHGFGSNPFLGSHLIRMFGTHGSLEDAEQVFSNISERNGFSVHAMILAYTMLGEGKKALCLYKELQWSVSNIGEHLFVAIIKACQLISSLVFGMIVHAHAVENACEGYDYVGSALVDMYYKLGSLVNARSVFDRLQNLDRVAWTSMISGYACNGDGHEALRLFQQMQDAGIEPDDITLASSLKACSETRNLEFGKLIHGNIIMYGSDTDIYIGSTLIDMYNECGTVANARKVFNNLPNRNVVIWSAIIAGYALHGPAEEALRLFRQMLQERVQPNSVTCVSLLKACCSGSSLDQARLLHSIVIENSFDSYVQIGSTVIDVYAKCGSIQDAQRMFDKHLGHSLVTWNALISGYAQCGDHISTLRCFKSMQGKGFRPNDVTFVSLLASCSHLGVVEDACEVFESMREFFGNSLVLDHYNCMIDLFGRTGRTAVAVDLLWTSPFQTNTVGWSALMTHCKKHGFVNLARSCFNQLGEMDYEYSSGYTLMNSDAGM